ncbi:23S rRNA (uridine(2479)-2'-O)-methyltransferase [Abditibacteriota bacterium]|nr:23S rRNA (uridine(2479)-2'-O)-methyltransferase [Abditibacteriota bacterium]
MATLKLMPEVVLSSRAHPLLKLGRSLHETKGRREQGLFLIEGTNAFGAALEARWPLREVFALESEREWVGKAQSRGLKVHRATREWLGAMCDLQTPPPIVAWGEIPPNTSRLAFGDGLIIVLDGISDPGNVGTIWRAAHALGASAMVCTHGTADVWNPKVVRGAAGSLFALPPLALRDDSPAFLARVFAEQNVDIVRADAHGMTALNEFVWPRRAALVLGHERRGVSDEFQGASVTIPLPGQAESLNVAMAGTIFLWEWARTTVTLGAR